jgi:hypothetical protein
MTYPATTPRFFQQRKDVADVVASGLIRLTKYCVDLILAHAGFKFFVIFWRDFGADCRIAAR